MKAVLDAVDFGLLLIDQQGAIHTANRWIRERSRAGRELAGQPLATAFNAPIDPHLARAVRSCLDLGNSSRLSQAFHPMPLPLFKPDTDGSQRVRQAVDVTSLRIDAEPDRLCLVQVRDMTEVVKREQLLRDQSKQLSAELLRLTAAHREIERQSLRFRELARMAPVGLFEADSEGLVTYCNARTCEMLALEPAGALHRVWSDLFALPPELQAQQRARWLAATTTGLRYCDEFFLARGSQAGRWLRVEASAVPLPEGHQQGYIFTLVDVTEFREDAQRHEYRANHDPLTGLANRERFDDRLQRLLAAGASKAPTEPVAVIFIDLNHFKQINDTHGHNAGDVVLKAVAARIRRAVRSEDLVARLGGDEFAVVVEGVGEARVMERIVRKIDKAIGLPINIGSCHVQADAALGWALASEESADPKALLAAADAAMYRNKRHSAFAEV